MTLIGSIASHYRILGRLGEGGMGDADRALEGLDPEVSTAHRSPGKEKRLF